MKDTKSLNSNVEDLTTKVVEFHNELKSLLDQETRENNEREKAREEEQRKKDECRDAKIAQISGIIQHFMQDLSVTTASHQPALGPSHARIHSPPELRVNQETLERILDIPDIDIADMKQIEAKAWKVDPDQRVQAEGITKLQQFKDWMLSPSSSKLLVHDASRDSRYNDNGGLHVGGHAMIKSLVAQLLRQHAFDTRSLPDDIMPLDDVNRLCTLFGWLVGQLPRNITLVCLIDGIEYYEREAYLQEMTKVLIYILELITERNLAVDFKILVTSPGKSREVRKAFNDDGADSEIISVAARTHKGGTPSKRGLQRRLAQGFEDYSG
ncbi:hypothetical protein GGS24DRAFT_503162 [Hypoxylon argillaceum]|nr:hypothetical protein GGS24DRAFT_503162 [Hypoxylon argillaceum]